ncbi:MAG: DsbA family protein, partial [Gammaproteobacteria bacterium]
LEARNPSDDETLIALAEAMGLERERFTLDLNSAATQAELSRQIRFAARLGARGSPSLTLTAGGEARPIAYDYRDPAVVLEQLGL